MSASAPIRSSAAPQALSWRRRLRRARPGVALALLLALAPARAAEAPGRLLAWAGPARTPAHVDLAVGKGVVVLAGAETDRAVVSVRLSADTGEGGETAGGTAPGADGPRAGRGAGAHSAAIAGAQLMTRSSADTLTLSVAYPASTDPMGIREQWTVTLPAPTAATVEMTSGRLFVRDLQGDLDLRVGVGAVRVASAGPSVRVRVSLGDIQVASRAAPGRLMIASAVGKALMRVHGRVVPARRIGPGAIASFDGPGSGVCELRTDRGDVALEIVDY